MKPLLYLAVMSFVFAGTASAQQGYDFLKRDNPYGVAESPQKELPRLGQSFAVARLGLTVYQSKAPDGHALIVIDQIEPTGALGNMRNQIPSASVVINAVESYHPGTIAQLAQIMGTHKSGDIVKLELLQLVPKIGVASFSVKLN